MRGSSQRASRPSSTENSSRSGDIRSGLDRCLGAGIARRVGNARVIDAGEQGDERLFDARQVTQGQVAVVELAFLETLPNDAIDQLLDRLTRVVAGGSRGRLGAIGQHEDRRLA